MLEKPAFKSEILQLFDFLKLTSQQFTSWTNSFFYWFWVFISSLIIFLRDFSS